MYCDFFGFKEKPFNVTSDPEFFFLSRKHKEAIACMFYGVNERKGIITITGEIGIGKTTLCKVLLKRLQAEVKTSLVLNPYFSELQLLEFIIQDFGISVNKKSRLDLINGLNSFLLASYKSGHNAVIIVDEAQNLRPRQLEQIRLLSNLETDKEKLLQIILIGQPELRQKLDLTSLRQLKQRIMVDYHIDPLDESETSDYIHHRLRVASITENIKIKFCAQALKSIYKFSKGLPRLVNLICDRSILACFCAEKTEIDLEMIDDCIKDVSPQLNKGAG